MDVHSRTICFARVPAGGYILAALFAATALVATPTRTSAQGPLKSAKPFAVLGGSTVTNTGTTVINGNLGVSPGTAITGTSSIVLTGTQHNDDAVATQAQVDALGAYNFFHSLSSTMDLSGVNLGGLTLLPGTYFFASSAQLTGALTLDFAGNPLSQFIFQVGSTLTTASGSSVITKNGGSGNGLFWQVGSSATLGTGTAFEGNILANQSITLTTGSTIICGRAIALNGAVTMDTNVISDDCSKGGDEGTGMSDFGSEGFSGLPPVTPPVTVAPEPGTLWLFATSLALLAGATRFRRRRQPASLQLT